jgi:hypothetical protein
MSEEHPTPAPQWNPGEFTGQITGTFTGMSFATIAGLYPAPAPAAPPVVAPLSWTGPYNTDFITFATGGGANVEDMPSYGTDAQIGTGNLPGVARSNFNNRAIRQGTFVAAAVSTFLAQQLVPGVTPYIADDGDLLKYVGYFREAIALMITSAQPPSGQYLPIAGGTMVGVIDYTPGTAASRLPNNTYFTAYDTSHVQHAILGMNTSNQIQLGSGAVAIYYVGGSHTFNGSIGIPNSASLNSNNAANNASFQMIQIFNDNNLYIGPGPGSNIYRCAAGGSHNFNNNIVLPNNIWVYGTDTSGAVRQAFGLASDNQFYAGDGVHNQIIRAPNLYITGTAWHSSNVVVPNNANYYGDITNGTPYAILGVRSDNACVVGNSGLTTVYLGNNNVFNSGIYSYGNISFAGTSSVLIGNNAWLGSYNTTGSWVGLIGFLNDNQLHIGTWGNVYIANTVICGGAIILPNNVPYYTKDTGGTAWNMLNMGGDNQIYLGQDGQHNVIIRGNIWTNANFYPAGNVVTGNTLQGGYIHSTGSVDADWQMHVGNWLYAGAIQSYGALNCNGVLNVQGCDLYNNGGWLSTDQPFAANQIAGNHCTSWGDGYTNGTHWCGSDCHVAGSLFVGGMHIWNDGIGYLQSDSSFRAPYIQSWGDLGAQHGVFNNGLCVGGSGVNFDYIAAFPYDNHSQWYDGLGLYAAFFVPYSDERYKQNIAEVERDALAAILPIRFFQYDIEHTGPRAKEPGFKDSHGHVATGLLAQQVRESLPDAVVETDQPVSFHMHPEDTSADGCFWETRPTLGLDIMTLIAYQMRAIQQLAARVAALEAARA